MIAFLFSGQGAQYSGMMKDISDDIKDAREVFDIADKSLQRDISGLCFKGSQEELNLTHNTQPCVIASDLAAYKAIMAAGIKPDAVAGFSLGEYAALVASNVISIKDVFPIVQKRADYMQEAVPAGKGAMAAVMKLSAEEVESICEEIEGYVIPANYNCPGQIVVSGEADAVDKLIELTKERKIKAVKLSVSAPFHCKMMSSAADKLGETLEQFEFGIPTIPIYLNVDAKPESDKEKIREKLKLQAKSPVCWEETLRNMVAACVDLFVEIGPGKTLSGFVKKTFGDEIRIYNVADMKSLKETIEAVNK